jgi:hypothetical protein
MWHVCWDLSAAVEMTNFFGKKKDGVFLLNIFHLKSEV